MFYPYLVNGGLVWMLPIVFLSFISMAFILERLWYWARQTIHSHERKEILGKILHAPWQLSKAMEHCRHSKDSVVLTLHEFLLHYENVSLPIAERKARLFAESKGQESRHFLYLLTVIANIAGTLGLLGTVVGISMIFKSLAQEDSKGVALALSTAVYTTVAGILLFLLSYLPLFFFQTLSENLEDALDSNIQKLKDFLEVQEKSKMIFEEKSHTTASLLQEEIISDKIPDKESEEENIKTTLMEK